MACQAFDTWGLRVPFLVPIVLIALSHYVRARVDKSPVFEDVKAKDRLMVRLRGTTRDFDSLWPGLASAA